MDDPLTGEPVDVMWVKGSGGDLGSMKLDGFATLYLDKVLALESNYRGLDHEDEILKRRIERQKDDVDIKRVMSPASIIRMQRIVENVYVEDMDMTMALERVAYHAGRGVHEKEPST